MKISTARKIVSKNGIAWTNWIDLKFVYDNMNKQSDPRITRAIETILNNLI